MQEFFLLDTYVAGYAYAETMHSVQIAGGKAGNGFHIQNSKIGKMGRLSKQYCSQHKGIVEKELRLKWDVSPIEHAVEMETLCSNNGMSIEIEKHYCCACDRKGDVEGQVCMEERGNCEISTVVTCRATCGKNTDRVYTRTWSQAGCDRNEHCWDIV